MKLANLRASNEELIKDFNISVDDFNFKVKSDDWVGVTYEQFSKILNDKKQKYINSFSVVPDFVSESPPLNTIRYPDHHDSNWILYLNKLKQSGWNEEDLETLKQSVWNTIIKLTTSNPPSTIKGLVVGHVQSGKTANFAGLLALAADNGFNLFIVLSGIIDNLRRQTEERLLSDLRNGESSIVWNSINNPKITKDLNSLPTAVSLGNINRYIIVSLKNVTRLKNLRDWLWHDQNVSKNMKILLIDDEADQASINTLVEKNDATTINRLIREIVHGGELHKDIFLNPAKIRKDRNLKNKTIERYNSLIKYGSMNYIGYTGTPYANILNETGRTSLFPFNFISSLKTSSTYFGSKRIFGNEANYDENLDETFFESSGIGITREIDENDLEEIKSLQDNSSIEIPKSLKNAIAWYICCASAFRLYKFLSPSSMLIHTSQKIAHHTNLTEAVKKWLVNKKTEVIELCKSVYSIETKKLPKLIFRERLNEIDRSEIYPNLENINDYPPFEKLTSEISTLLNKITHIKLNEDGDPLYHSGIHICEDNSKSNESEEEVFKLIYPPRPRDISHAFIVIGGATLSRGLTIEGLVSSYFLRTSTTNIDALTQMGRWFGYRRGFEIFPRIWMSGQTLNYFKMISLSEDSLREEIGKYSQMNKTPKDFAPRVLTHPDSGLNPTARNRMHKARKVSFSKNIYETSSFPGNEKILDQNIGITKNFLLGLGNFNQKEDHFLWKGIENDKITSYLNKYIFYKNSDIGRYKNLIIQWFTLLNTKWNVAICSGNSKNNWIVNNEISIKKMMVGAQTVPESVKILNNQSSIKKDDHYLYRGISNRKHALIDIEKDFPNLSKDTQIIKYRIDNKIDGTPLLIVYNVDKDHKNYSGNIDLIGLYIIFPNVGDETFIQAEVTPIDFDQSDLDDSEDD